jgi:protein-tyrosine phosphatase
MFVRLLIYKRRLDPWVDAAPAVLCGRLMMGREARAMRERGVTAVLDLTAEHAETRQFLEMANSSDRSISREALRYFNVPVLDLTGPSQEQLNAAVGFIEEHSRRGVVYVHCALGISRTAAVVSAYKATLEASGRAVSSR